MYEMDAAMVSVTKETASFEWEPVPCEERYGSTVGYLYEVVQRPLGIIASTQLLNHTVVSIDDLVPYTNYTFKVKFVNHVGGGRFTESIHFKTHQAREYSVQIQKLYSELTVRIK